MTTTQTWTAVTPTPSSGLDNEEEWTAHSLLSAHVTVDAAPTSPHHTDQPDSRFLGDTSMTSLRTALDCGVIPVLAVLGIVGNCLCVVVFVKQRYKSVAKPLLIALCASDVLFLLATLLVSLPCIVRKVNREKGDALNVHMIPQVDVFRDIMSRVTIILTLAIGVERCIAVTRPLKLRGFCSIPRTRSTVLIIFLGVFALKSPAFFCYDVKHHVVSDNVTSFALYRTKFYTDNKNTLDFYLNYFLLVMLQGLPLVSITVCFGIVLVSLKRRLQCAYPRTIAVIGAFDRAKGKAPDKYTESEHADLVLEERKLTRALLVILLVSFMSELPYMATETIHVIQPDSQSSSLKVARDVSRLISVLNSAVNFMVFMMLYKHFSVTFKALAGLCH